MSNRTIRHKIYIHRTPEGLACSTHVPISRIVATIEFAEALRLTDASNLLLEQWRDLKMVVSEPLVITSEPRFLDDISLEEIGRALAEVHKRLGQEQKGIRQK